MTELFITEEPDGAKWKSRAPGFAHFIHWGAICREVKEPAIHTILQEADVPVADQDKAQLSQYIISHAKILFALADKTDVLHLVPELAKLKLTDDYLPIVWDGTQGRAKSLQGAPQDDTALGWFDFSLSDIHSNPRAQKKHERWIQNFCRAQWEFLAPVFTDTEIVYPLHDECPLPFTYYNEAPAASASNSVLIKGDIHRSHWKAIRRPGQPADVAINRPTVPVAIKKITKQHEATDMWVQVEVAALELVRSLHHAHLINFLTSYRQGGIHYLLFDWANGGDLSSFWKTNSPKPRDPGDLSHRETIVWAIKQMAGLASGLHMLHTQDEHGVHCRHGDLKPANILRSTTDQDLSLKSRGKLLITDMGVAKINDKATHVGRSSGNLKATIRYQSPEFMFRVSPDAPTSRAYDMWSMGCTLLEFIIWLLYGPSQLKAFNDSFENSPFFSEHSRDEVRLKSAVKHWVDHLQADTLSKDDARCVSRALREILDFILQRLLIKDVRPELESPINAIGPGVITQAVTVTVSPTGNGGLADSRRAQSEELLKKLDHVCAKEEASYFLLEPSNGEEHFLAPPPQLKSTTGVSSSPAAMSPKVPAANLLQVPVGGIQETSSLLSWDLLQPRYADLPKGQADPDLPYVTDYLRDSWDAIPDNELALQLFPEIALADVVPENTIRSSASMPYTHIKGLCARCSDERSGVFSLRFVCEESVNALGMNKAQCGVCWMLWQHALQAGTAPQSVVKFLRSGSYLMQSLEQGTPDKPIFALVVGPGITTAPKDLQRSFPRLPRVATQPGREAAGPLKPRPGLTISGDEPMFTIIKKWADDCDKKHTAQNRDQPNCNSSRPRLRLPTRLIYVGKGGATNIYLKCRREENDKKESGDYSDKDDEGLKYIALSHRWGYPRGDPEWTTTMPDGTTRIKSFSTTDVNVEEFKDPSRGIDFAAMPKTFRDAIEVTRGLGVQYLWIDSLCIIQDQADKRDFKAEAPRMRDVYSGAYLTIASTRALGTTDGFLDKKPDRSCVRVDTVRRVLGPSVQGLPDNEDSTVDKQCTVYVCDAIDDFKKDVDEADMATRGWIFQERALSRRTLHFGENQIYWECGAGVCCETMTRLFNRRATFMSDPDFPSQARNYNRGMKIRFYEVLYQHYSTLDFSVLPDRALAMAGLESKILTTFQTKGAYGVMDGEFLHRTLLWRRGDELPGGEMRKISFKKNDAKPPSWSWMAVSGKITYLPVEFRTVDWAVDDIRSPFRQAGDSYLGLLADDQLAPMMAVVRNIDWTAVAPGAESLFLDRGGLPSSVPGLKCVVMGTKKEQPTGGGRADRAPFQLPLLLVAPKPEAPSLYERVGVGKLMDHELEPEAEAEDKVWVEIH